jgi:hypothetical protein
MEPIFGTLAPGTRDTRDVLLCGRVLTARRLGSVFFLSVDNITSFLFYPNCEQNEPFLHPSGDDFYIQLQSRHGCAVELPEDDGVVQVVLTKEDFNGEIRPNTDGTIDIHESLKDLARTIAMGHTVDILLCEVMKCDQHTL